MRIGIIGSGGAGMCAAWLLEEDHEVTLFERDPMLGGHAHTTLVTIGGRTYPCDDGFGWFSDRMYPLLTRFLAVLGVETRIVPLAVAFTNRMLDRSVALPPTSAASLGRLLREPHRRRWLVAMQRAMRAGSALVAARDHERTLADFVDGLAVDDDLRQDFLRPFLFGMWGGPWERSAGYSAYTLLRYPVFHRPSGLRWMRWRVVAGGAASYIEALGAAMKRVRILAGVPVVAIARSSTGDERRAAWQVRDGRGETHEFDHLVSATGAGEAQALLAAVTGADAQREALAGFETFAATVVTHRDASFMPPSRADWLPTHVDFDGHSSRLTIWTGWRDGVDLFVSWVGEREPREVLSRSRFRLPLMTPAHFRAQERLDAVQGQDCLHFCGAYIADIGTHEDALRSAVAVARRIAPRSTRLAVLLKSLP